MGRFNPPPFVRPGRCGSRCGVSDGPLPGARVAACACIHVHRTRAVWHRAGHAPVAHAFKHPTGA
eukprot:183564-Chlamydomonas_euryale.AAC.1